MDVDGSGPGPGDPSAEAAAATAALHGAMAARCTNNTPLVISNSPGTANTNIHHKDNITASSPGSLFVQCSNAKNVGRTINLHECTPNESGPSFDTTKATIPRVGSMYLQDRDDLAGVFHGARLMRGGVQTNEVLTCSFDSATLNCLACPKSHRMLDKSLPVTICFSDQNFIPTLRSNPGETCIAVVRVEDAALSDLAAIALEIIDKFSLHPGSVLLFGSASHLFRVGASCYAQDWIGLLGKIEQRFKNVNVCPLIPILRETCPGPLARDIEILATWLVNVYPSNIKGLSESWRALVHFVQNAGSGQTVLAWEEHVKIPLPTSLTSAQLHPWYFCQRSSNPALLQGMDCTVTKELVRILLAALQRDFSIAVGPEVILPRATTAAGDQSKPENRHLVCIGSSIMKQLIPFLQAAGYTITDFSQPGWVATEDNIQALIHKMSQLHLDPGFSVIFDLLSNCSHRYIQFDGTQSLPFKEGGRFHMAGPVTICNEDNFCKIVRSASPVLLAAQHARKIVIPPLPRYLFSKCCNNPTHCSNFLDAGYEEGALNGISKLRGILKKECSSIGMRNHWVLDGTGALAGIPPGESGGSNREILPELKVVLATDGVHLTQSGNKKVASAVIAALTLCGSGSAEKNAADPNSGPGPLRMPRKYYWRGFSSPVGDAVGRVAHGGSGGGVNTTGPQHHHQPRLDRDSRRGRPYSHHHRRKY
jgi:hypothetical protein